jgi:hypothetical protein
MRSPLQEHPLSRTARRCKPPLHYLWSEDLVNEVLTCSLRTAFRGVACIGASVAFLFSAIVSIILRHALNGALPAIISSVLLFAMGVQGYLSINRAIGMLEEHM